MQRSRWVRLVLPGLIAIGAAGSILTTATGATARLWAAKPCTESVVGSASVRSTPIGLREIGQQPWYRLDPRLDRSGGLEGQRLSFGLDRERDGRVLDLPAESFAAGPFGQTILVGSDDGGSSRLVLLDVPNDCIVELAVETEVIRRATLGPSGERLYEMRVDRATREDLGIWVRRLDGEADPAQVLPAILPDERFGRTFSTEFAWALDGTRLAVQSCGEVACRTRVVDPADGTFATIDRGDLGTMVGLDRSTLVSYAACRGLPCPILAVDIGGGISTIADAAAAAVLVTTPAGPRLVHEVFQGRVIGLRSTTLDGSTTVDLGTLDGDLRLVQPPGLAGAATVVPEGWVALAPDGRLPIVDPPARVGLRQVSSGQTVQLQEVIQ